MSSPFSPIITPSGKPFGREELIARIQGWFEDVRLMRLMVRVAPTSPQELTMIWRDLPRMNEWALARVVLWMLKHRLTRMAVARIEVQQGGKRQEVKESLRSLAEWAEQRCTRPKTGLILPS